MADEGHFQVANRPIKTVLPVDTTELTIRLMDWRRVHRKVRQIPEHSSLYSNLAFGSFGVCGSAALSVIPYFQVRAITNDPWLLPTYIVVCVATAILGIIFLRMARDKDSDAKSTCSEVMTDMAEIHQCYFPGQPIEPPQSPSDLRLRTALRLIRWISMLVIFTIVCAGKGFGGPDVQGGCIAIAVSLGFSDIGIIIWAINLAITASKRNQPSA